jgi:hypothetical protein
MANERARPRPWFGCDTSGPAWKAYCEAWTHVFVKGHSARVRDKIHNDPAGKARLAALDHNIELVRRDYRGEFDDRTEIARLLR